MNMQRQGCKVHQLVSMSMRRAFGLCAVCEGYSDGKVFTVKGGLAKTKRSLTLLIVDEESVCYP